jgi:hypothetical protein
MGIRAGTQCNPCLHIPPGHWWPQNEDQPAQTKQSRKRIVRSPSRGGAMPGAAPAPLHSTHVTPCDSGHSLAVPAAAHSGPRSLHHLCRAWPRTENRNRPAGAAAGSAAEAAAAGSAAEAATAAAAGAGAARAALVGGEAVLEVSARF